MLRAMQQILSVRQVDMRGTGCRLMVSGIILTVHGMIRRAVVMSVIRIICRKLFGQTIRQKTWRILPLKENICGNIII